MAQGAATW